MQVEKRVAALVEEKIADRPELFLVEVKMLPNNKLIIHVDGDEGISIQDCVAISRHVGFHLEEENVIEQAYNLEVSSPGVGEPLKLIRQYNKNVGRTVSIKLKEGLNRISEREMPNGQYFLILNLDGEYSMHKLQILQK